MQRMRRTRKAGMAGKVIHGLICLIYRVRFCLAHGQAICADGMAGRQQQCPAYVYAHVPRRRRATGIR